MNSSRKIIPALGLVIMIVAVALWWFIPSQSLPARVGKNETVIKKETIEQHTSDSASLSPHNLQPQDAVDAFLAQHWKDPISPQGKPPAHFSAHEASLAPETCGQCHVQQYQDWQHSLHSKTMGPGILWQLRLMTQADGNQCMKCHAPLAEQKALIAQAQGWPNAPQQKPPAYVPADLGHQGLVCASCHVRKHQRFGPEPLKEMAAQLPHDGFTIAPAFEDSRFCAACHQFPQDGPRTNNKLREDTYAQWQQSAFAKNGQQCQSCHMPDRKHQWKGIHDQRMVTNALSTQLTRDGNRIYVDIINSGAGHYFPTYMVPKVIVELRYRAGNEKKFSVIATDTIGWNVDVSLAQELADTRIPSGAKRRISATLPADFDSKGTIDIYLTVKPREHYERTFLSVLDQRDKLDAETLTLLQAAYDEAVNTQYQFNLRTYSLTEEN
ncbi:multiheme c-type cytochrome [Cellvibrio mixtus]|uniref:multiheme c-type cytochrome n=1 Tax=Cellvibrio mixtus TaxID=39650 RepID=UPI0006945531|nr:hypothetical protein [Cellvibrio mixtus]